MCKVSSVFSIQILLNFLVFLKQCRRLPLEEMKFQIGSILIFLFISLIGLGQGSEKTERKWLIDYYFMDVPDFQNQLIEIDNYLLLGKYKEAKVLISNQKSKDLRGFERAAILCYEANIAYNESEYQRSIDLCDESLDLLRKNKLKNRYWVKATNMKAKGLGALNEYGKAEQLIDSAIALATNIQDKNGLAASYYYLGAFASDKGDYRTCAQFMDKSSALRKEIKDEIGLAACYAFLGLCYSYMDDYIKGIDYIQKSIVIRERIQDKRGLANSYLTLYKVYYEIGEMDKAMESEFRSLSICKELKDLQCVSGRYTNIGQIYQKKGNDKRALFYHFLALDLSKQLNIKNRIALVHENIARVYLHTKQYNLAISHLDSSKFLRESFGDESGLASIDLIRAAIQLEQNDPNAAEISGLRALSIGKELKLPHIIKEAHSLLHEVYSKKQNVSKAYFHYKSFVVLRDSIFNIDQSKELLRKELEFNFNKEKELQRLESEKKNEKAKLESKKQQTIIAYGSSALAIVSLLLGFSIWQYRLKNRSKKELEIANHDLNNKHNELQEKSKIIETQNVTIQHKNNEITDSIRYAHQIQRAVLPTEEEFKQFFSEAFVIFQPKDIISGDFYWVTAQNDLTIYATADCTGHGVPGGFMSMLGVSLLNELVNENKILEPAEIFSKLRDKVITSLKQKGLSGEQQDGMDMTLCVLDKRSNKLYYAAANHSLYLVRMEEGSPMLHEYRGDKHPVGIFGEQLLPFHAFEIDTQPGDTIYTFTDGFADQFGGEKGKKYKYKQLKELITGLQPKSLKEQEEEFRLAFQQWKGELEQVDDVCLIAVKV